MRSVVMIAYHFPPEGSAGAYRPLRFVRHLPSHGYRPFVIAGEPSYYERYDPELLKLLPSGTEVIRVSNRDPWQKIQGRRQQRIREIMTSATPDTVAGLQRSHQRPVRSLLRGAVRRIESTLYCPDLARGWIHPATQAAAAACERGSADVVWATGGPWSSFVVARNVSRRTGKPYVLDFRDSWTLVQDDFDLQQPEWARARCRRLLSRLFSGAQAVVFRYMAEAESYWRAYSSVLDARRIHLIPNGYEGEIANFEPPRRERCTLLYTGTLNRYGYETVLDALVRMKQSDPVAARELRVLFVGEGTEVIDEAAHRLDLADLVETTGVVPFAEVTRLQSQADALLLLGWKPSRGNELGGSKIFGYLKAGRPIIGVLPRDENTKILQSLGVESATIADAGSVTEIVGALTRLLDAWRTSSLSTLLPDRTACQEYSAEYQTDSLVRALGGLPAQVPFQPGACSVPPSLETALSAYVG